MSCLQGGIACFLGSRRVSRKSLPAWPRPALRFDPMMLFYKLSQRSVALQVNVVAPHNRDKTAWIGGSMFASRNNFKDVCMSSQEYAEFGPNVLRRSSLSSLFSLV
jgi:actin-related protein